MEQRRTRIVGDEVDFRIVGPTRNVHNILQNPCCRLPIKPRDFEIVAMQVQWVAVTGVVVKAKSIAFTSFHEKRVGVRVLLAVDRPAIECNPLPRYFSESQIESSIGFGDRRRLGAKNRVIPRGFGCVIPGNFRWSDPLRLALLSGVLDNHAHPRIAVFIIRGTQNPNPRSIHFDYRIDSFRDRQLEHVQHLRRRRRVAIQGKHLKLVPGQCEADVLGSACIEETEQYSFAQLNANGLTVSQRFVIYRTGAIGDLPPIVARSFVGKRWLPLTSSQENFLIIPSGLVFGLNIKESELSGEGSSLEVSFRHRMRVIPACSGWLWHERKPTTAARGNKRSSFLLGAVDIRRDELAMP